MRFSRILPSFYFVGRSKQRNNVSFFCFYALLFHFFILFSIYSLSSAFLWFFRELYLGIWLKYFRQRKKRESVRERESVMCVLALPTQFLRIIKYIRCVPYALHFLVAHWLSLLVDPYSSSLLISARSRSQRVIICMCRLFTSLCHLCYYLCKTLTHIVPSP